MRKFIVFLFSLVSMGCMFNMKVGATPNAVSIQSATASTSDDQLHIEVVVRATSEATFNARYYLSISDAMATNGLIYLDQEVTIQWAKESTPNNKNDYNAFYENSGYNNRLEFRVLRSSETILYYISYVIDLDEGSLNGNIIDKVDLTYTEGGVEVEDIPDSNGYRMSASIVMNQTSGKGTFNCSVDFTQNNYEAGWYMFDLNYAKEYYGFLETIDSVLVTCASNNDLANTISNSINIDEGGNVVYFALPDLNNFTGVLSLSVIFGEEAMGSTFSNTERCAFIKQLTPSLTNQAMAFSGEQYSYVISVDAPKTIEQVISGCGISAYDDRCGSRSVTYTDTNDYITKVSSVNDTKSRTLGDYLISFNASDEGSNASSLSVKLVVKDLISPVISTNDSVLLYERSYTDSLISDNDLIGGIVASDNYVDSGLLTISVDSSSYQAGYTVVNQYNVPVVVSDPSGNEVRSSIIMRVVDRIPPVIEGSATFSTSYTSEITAGEIVERCGVTANDELDGNIAVSIHSDNYTANKSVPGNYEIVVKATDNSGNTAYFTITVTVTDTIKPYFLVNKTTLIVGNGYAYTTSQIVDMATDSGLIRAGYKDVEVVSDDYSNNYLYEGTYLYRLRVKYDDSEEYVDISLKVVNDAKEVVKVKWYTKIGTFFTRTFTRIGHFFSDIVYEKGIKKVFGFIKSAFNNIFRR